VRVGRRGLATLLGLALALAAAPASAAGQDLDGVIGPYDGSIPFKCQLQYAGTGVEFPDPAADPFCVEYDKTNQNVTQFGILEFLLQEPVRVAQALPKCFYFQRDHWTGSIVQGSQPELWHWDGDYWYDIARGVGGASVRNFRLGGVPMDATPYVPNPYLPYFDPDGGGGAMVELELDPPTHCTSRVDTPEERDLVYAGRPGFLGCVEPGGELHGRRAGAVRLGMRRSRVVAKLGIPHDHRHGVDRWCVIGKGQLRVAYTGRDSGSVTLIRTSARGHTAKRVGHGDPVGRAKRRLRLREHFSLGQATILEAPRTARRRLLVGAANGHVRWLAVATPEAAKSAEALRRLLRRTR
jgi:hypothetical protein